MRIGSSHLTLILNVEISIVYICMVNMSIISSWRSTQTHAEIHIGLCLKLAILQLLKSTSSTWSILVEMLKSFIRKECKLHLNEKIKKTGDMNNALMLNSHLLVTFPKYKDETLKLEILSFWAASENFHFASHLLKMIWEKLLCLHMLFLTAILN